MRLRGAINILMLHLVISHTRVLSAVERTYPVRSEQRLTIDFRSRVKIDSARVALSEKLSK